MSSRAVRAITKARPSKVSNSPASPPINVDFATRRTSRMVTKINSVPQTSDANRQPKEFIPNSASPNPISHLPTGGCTMNASVFCSPTSGLPAMTCALASPRHSRS